MNRNKTQRTFNISLQTDRSVEKLTRIKSISIEILLNGKTVRTNDLTVNEALIAKSDKTDCLKTKDSTG